MTINLTLFGQDFVLQAADRLISDKSGPAGTMNKAVVFMSDRLRACVVYTGLSNHPDGTRTNTTDFWIGDALAKSHLIEADIKSVVEAITSSANARWGALPADWASEPLLLTVAGWDVKSLMPVGGIISNCLDQQGRLAAVRSAFRGDLFPSGGRTYLAGDIDAVSRRAEERGLDRLARLNRSEGQLLDAVVGVVRRTAKAATTISDDPVVVRLPLDGPASAWYCPPNQTRLTFGPGMVHCTSEAVYLIMSPSAYDMPDGWSMDLGDADKGKSVTIKPRVGAAAPALPKHEPKGR